MTHHTNVRLGDKGKSPQLPPFCRTRRPITTTVRVSTLQQLLWLLLLVVFLQLSTVLLVLARPLPASLRPAAIQLVLPPRDPLTAAQLATPGAMPPGRWRHATAPSGLPSPHLFSHEQHDRSGALPVRGAPHPGEHR